MMKRFLVIIPFLSFLFFSLGNSANQNVSLPKKDKEIIVELNDFYGTSVESRKNIKEQFIHSLNNELSFNYDVKKSYNTIGNLLFLDIPSEYYERIKDIPLVKEVSENKTYKNSYDENSYNPFLSDKAPDRNYSRVDMNIPTTGNDGAGTIISIIDSGFNISHEMFKNLTTPLRYTKYDIQILKNTSGFVGKNAGYRDDKIPFYYSYGTNNTTMSFTNDKSYHGGHVAGIAAANNVIYGAAPNAQLALMKVTDNAGSFTDFGIFSALEDSAILDVDAINMSFGNELVDFGASKLLLDVTNNLKDLGIIVNVSAGNEGKESLELSSYQNYLTSDVETSFLGTFASLDSVNTIGALNILENEMISSSLSTYSGTNFRVRDQLVDHKVDDNGTVITEIYDKMYPFYSLIPTDESMIALDYVRVPNYGKIEDYKDINAQGKVAVIERGDNSFVDKIRNAVSNGAIAVLIYNGRTSDSQVGYMKLTDLEQKYYVPVGYINSSDGELLNNQVIKKINVSKELAASYSSDGSTSDLKLKPDISSPGSAVYSGIGPENNKYAYYDGTSMAAPNVSGSIANIISNIDFKNNDERSAYRKTVSNRIMSTATPLLETSGAYYSPRKVGAGRINVASAINSSVYLEGNVNGKAKIELKNNDDIKQGKVNFDVKTYNLSSEAKSYNATLVIEAPELTKVDRSFTTLTNTNLMTDKDVLLNKVTTNVTIPTGENTINFNASITEENKEYLANFENGTFLEGYVIFESLSNGYNLNIPYMGFYGDYNKSNAIEDFSFEQDTNKVYGSTLINSLATSYKLSGADYKSYIVANNTQFTSTQFNTVFKNSSSILSFGKEATFDKTDNYLRVGEKDFSTHLAFQTYINRNCINNSFTLTSLDTKQVVYTGFLNNSLYDTKSSSSHYLIKTMADVSSINSGLIANRGYASLDLVDSNEKLLYSDGLYELKFSFTLVNGTVQEKAYTLNIVNADLEEAPIILSREIIWDNNEKYMRIRFSSNSMNKVYVDSKSVNFKSDNKSYILELRISDYIKNKNLLITFVDVYKKTSEYLVNVTSIGSGGYAIISNELLTGDNFSVVISDKVIESDGDSYIYSFIVKDKNGSNIQFKNSINVTFEIPSKYEASSDSILVYDQDKNIDYESVTSFSVFDGAVTATTNSGILRVKFLKDNTNSGVGLSNGVAIGLLVGGFSILVGISISILILRRFNKKR